MGKIYIYGTIGNQVKAKEVIAQIDATNGPIDVYINSPGGDVYEGLAIYNALQRNRDRVTTYIDGLAYSAASWISQAASKGKRFMARAAQFGIHQALTSMGGNKQELSNKIELLDKIDCIQSEIYNASSGLDPAFISEIMKSGKPLSYDEAHQLGFIDGESNPLQIAALFNLNTNMDILEKFAEFMKGAKGEEITPEVKAEVTEEIKAKAEEAETPFDALAANLVKAEDFISYQKNVEPMLQAMFDYVKAQPTTEQIEAMIEKSANAKMIELVKKINSNGTVPTPQETGFMETKEEETFEALTLPEGFNILKLKNNK